MDIVKRIKGKIAYESELGITIHYMHRQELEGICSEIERLREALDEAIYLLNPTQEEMEKKAGIYRIVSARAALKGDE